MLDILPVSRYWIVFLSVPLAVGCTFKTSQHDKMSESSRSSIWFEEVSSDWGIQFVHSPGEVGDYFMPESIGSGAALFDCNNDGLLDVYLLQNAGADSGDSETPGNRLFQQIEPGRFRDVSDASGTNVSGRGMGVVAGDVNNDGWNDLFLTEYGRLRLLLNQTDGTFSDVTQEAGLKNPKWGTSACFLDYDRDGWLDIAVANYIEYDVTRQCFDRTGNREYCGPSGFPPAISRLFRNLGGQTQATQNRESCVRFEDVTVASGIAAHPGPGLGVIAADFDGDGWQDLFFADDAEPNRLFINQQDGTFREEALKRGIALNAMGQTQANMGVAVGDVDGNGLFDILVTHLKTETHALWRQQPRGFFQDASHKAGVTQTDWRGTGFGTLFGDFNQDSFPDLAIVNGAIKRDPKRPVQPQLGEFWSPYAERNQLLCNDGQGRFLDRSGEETDFSGVAAVSRGLACGDLDGDGSLDLVVTDISGPTRVYRNTCPKQGHWLMVRAIDPALGGRDAIGASVTVKADGYSATRIVSPSYSFLCSSDTRCHFGLGDRTSVGSITVNWPNGDIERFEGGSVDQWRLLRKGEGSRLVEPGT